LHSPRKKRICEGANEGMADSAGIVVATAPELPRRGAETRERARYARRVSDRALGATPARAGTEPDSEWWLTVLRADGPEREEAVGRLHDLMLRAARFELGRRRAALSHIRGEQLDDLAMQAANDALTAVLSKLDDFRGASRFTTWAYKFALLEAGVKLRRRAWQEREVILEPDAWIGFADRGGGVQSELESSELLGELKSAIDSTLTPHQRQVFVALALNEVPIDVLSERLSTTRGALYKTLHDARKKLRGELAASGLVEPNSDDPGRSG
jgi:RNA polymerase sigma-70 factor, ECF subfamily